MASEVASIEVTLKKNGADRYQNAPNPKVIEGFVKLDQTVTNWASTFSEIKATYVPEIRDDEVVVPIVLNGMEMNVVGPFESMEAAEKWAHGSNGGIEEVKRISREIHKLAE